LSISVAAGFISFYFEKFLKATGAGFLLEERNFMYLAKFFSMEKLLGLL